MYPFISQAVMPIFWGPQTNQRSEVIPNLSPDRLYICVRLNKNDWQVSQILLQVTVDS